MFMHLPDWNSPRTTIFLPNPGYIEYQSFDGPFDQSMEQIAILWGDAILSPTYTMEMESLALCGEPLLREPRRYPELLWTCVNYTLPCSIDTESVCRECLKRHAARKVSQLPGLPRHSAPGAPDSGSAVQAQP
jgi:hypothetical protein